VNFTSFFGVEIRLHRRISSKPGEDVGSELDSPLQLLQMTWEAKFQEHGLSSQIPRRTKRQEIWRRNKASGRDWE